MADQLTDDQIFDLLPVFRVLFTDVHDCNFRKRLGTVKRSTAQNPTDPNEKGTLFLTEFCNLLVRIKLMEELQEASRAFKSESVQVSGGVASQLEGRIGIYNRRTIRTPNVPDDGYAWKRYDQKEIPNARYPRNYFRCSHKYTQGCQANRLVQRIESDTDMFKVTYIGRHTCAQFPHKEGTELLILGTTFVFEALSLISEKLNCPLFGMVMGTVGFIICIAELCYRAWTEQVTLRWRGKLPLLYSRHPTYKPFGSIIQWFGLVAALRVAMPQLLRLCP